MFDYVSILTIKPISPYHLSLISHPYRLNSGHLLLRSFMWSSRSLNIWATMCCDGCCVYYMIFKVSPSLKLLDTSSKPLFHLWNSTQFQRAPERQNDAQTRVTILDEERLASACIHNMANPCDSPYPEVPLQVFQTWKAHRLVMIFPGKSAEKKKCSSD